MRVVEGSATRVSERARVVLARFTSWNWFVWITFSSVLTMNQCLQSVKALSTHCQGHLLNLGIKTTMTNSKQMKDVMGTVTEIISLVKYSPKRENLLGNIKDLIHFESLHTDDEIEVAPTLDKLSATRWTVRGNAY